MIFFTKEDLACYGEENAGYVCVIQQKMVTSSYATKVSPSYTSGLNEGLYYVSAHKLQRQFSNFAKCIYFYK